MRGGKKAARRCLRHGLLALISQRRKGRKERQRKEKERTGDSLFLRVTAAFGDPFYGLPALVL